MTAPDAGGRATAKTVPTVAPMTDPSAVALTRAEQRGARRRLLFLAVLVAAMFAFAALTLGRSPDDLREAVASFGTLAPSLFVLVWIVATPALFPGTVLGAAGGLIFGTALGVGVSVVGATLGAVASFLLARRLGHDAAQRLSGPRIERVQARVERNGFRAVVVARAAPGVPASLLYYACGLSRVRLRQFAAGVLVGGAPRVFAYTALGGSAGDLGSATGMAAIALIAAPPLVLALFAVRRRMLRPRAVHP